MEHSDLLYRAPAKAGYWQPTLRLRSMRHSIGDHDGWIVQQLWRNDRGDSEWRDLEKVDEMGFAINP